MDELMYELKRIRDEKVPRTSSIEPSERSSADLRCS
jgi:hypothetical protein